MPGPGATVVASAGLAVHSLKSVKLPCVHEGSAHADSLASGGAAKGTTTGTGTARGVNSSESSVTGVPGATATLLGLPRGMISFVYTLKTTRVKQNNS